MNEQNATTEAYLQNSILSTWSRNDKTWSVYYGKIWTVFVLYLDNDFFL